MNVRCERTDERMAPNWRPDSWLFCPCTGAYLLVQHTKVAVFVLMGLLLAAYLLVQDAKVAVLVLLGLLLAAYLLVQHSKVAVLVLLGLLLAAYLLVQHAKVAVFVLLGLLLAAALMPEVVTRRTEIFVSRSAEDGERTMGADQKH